jgi:hypothetical protein
MLLTTQRNMNGWTHVTFSAVQRGGYFVKAIDTVQMCDGRHKDL